VGVLLFLVQANVRTSRSSHSRFIFSGRDGCTVSTISTMLPISGMNERNHHGPA
jgi:hypothetical protein